MEEDITKRAMLALESLGSVVITDAEGRYIYVSPERLKRGRHTREELLGRYVHDIYPETLVDEVIKTQRPVILRPTMAQTPNGNLQSFVSYYPLIDGKECLGCFLYATFGRMSSAIEFTHIVAELFQGLEEARRELKAVQKGTAHYTTADIIGHSKAINLLKMEISMVARTSSNVLIQGETGTGKELVAHSIHNLSSRYRAPFLRVNCSAIPENLMESEFFGYEDGAFTGAKRGGRPGKFELASGGTLFLDEVHTLPISMQPKFLRVLQEGEVEHVGGGVSVPVDARIISATNIPLEDLVLSGNFRQDLYYRLNVVRIMIPPLRERKEDIPLLVDTFISQLDTRLGLKIQGVHPNVLDILMEHDWPGNVRELQNVIERAMNYAYEGILMPHHLHFFRPTPIEGRKEKLPQGDIPVSESVSLGKSLRQEMEYELIRDALFRCGGNKSATAKYLGWSRSTLYEKLKKLN